MSTLLASDDRRAIEPVPYLTLLLRGRFNVEVTTGEESLVRGEGCDGGVGCEVVDWDWVVDLGERGTRDEDDSMGRRGGAAVGGASRADVVNELDGREGGVTEGKGSIREL